MAPHCMELGSAKNGRCISYGTWTTRCAACVQQCRYAASCTYALYRLRLRNCTDTPPCIAASAQHLQAALLHLTHLQGTAGSYQKFLVRPGGRRFQGRTWAAQYAHGVAPRCTLWPARAESARDSARLHCGTGHVHCEHHGRGRARPVRGAWAVRCAAFHDGAAP